MNDLETKSKLYKDLSNDPSQSRKEAIETDILVFLLSIKHLEQAMQVQHQQIAVMS